MCVNILVKSKIDLDVDFELYQSNKCNLLSVGSVKAGLLSTEKIPGPAPESKV